MAVSGAVRGIWIGVLVVGLTGSPLVAQVASTTQDERNFRAEVVGSEIVAIQGRDESLQSVRVAIWGQLRDPGRLRTREVQLDDDPELESVVVSRNAGTGPYYRVQIVSSRPFGILIWSYPSCGSPR